MKRLITYRTDWLTKMLFILFCVFAFQNSMVVAFVSPIILEQSHHTGISEVCIYDAIESSAHVEVDHTAGLSRVLLIKEARPDHEVLAGVASVAAKGGATGAHYSVAFETKLASNLYPEKGYYTHF